MILNIIMLFLMIVMYLVVFLFIKFFGVEFVDIMVINVCVWNLKVVVCIWKRIIKFYVKLLNCLNNLMYKFGKLIELKLIIFWKICIFFV